MTKTKAIEKATTLCVADDYGYSCTREDLLNFVDVLYNDFAIVLTEAIQKTPPEQIELSKSILAIICDLHEMEDVAQKVREYK